MNGRTLLSDTLLAGLSHFVAARIGLHFPQQRWRDLERGIIAATPELGQPDPESCARWLLSAPLTRIHVEILASNLTIGETYFFREKKSLSIFETQIVPELLRSRRSGTRHLRIWSAGCCTGEEPYSIAMLLDRLIPDPEKWNITLLATDINPRFLRKAAEGIYSEWSFRDTPEWVRRRHFKSLGDGRLELSAHIRKKVTFSYLNLADDVYPSVLNNTNAMDVIFCRNVLMYFTPERVKQVVRNFHHGLIDGGWLVVSPTETSTTASSLFSAVEFPGAVLYRKTGDAAPVPVATGQSAAMAHPARLLEVSVPSVVVAKMPPVRKKQAPVPAPIGSSLRVPDDDESPSTMARICANQGRLDEAIEWCEKAIAIDKMNPARHYLLAAIRQEQGQIDAAAKSLNRALYLDSGFVLAHFAFGNLRLSQGQRREAERHFTNVLDTLQAHSQDEILPESDGLTAGRLAEIVTSVLASLPRSVAVVRT